MPSSSNALRRGAWAIPVLVVGVLALPLLTDRTFGNDWPDHLWLVWQQSKDWGELGRPSYFLQTAQGIYEPFFAFYGGTFYAATGGLSALFGQHPIVAFVAVIVAAFAGAYAGWTWLARQLGLRGWRAQVPGLLFVTSPYFITNPFGRGDIPEAVATASIPVVAASALAVLRSERPKALTAAALVCSSAWFTACHNVTALWGTTFLAATGVVLLFAFSRHRPEAQPRRLLLAIGLVALGVAVNAWYLFPTLAYSGTTAIAKNETLGVSNLDSFREVFSPLRTSFEEIYQPRNALGWTNDAGRINVEMPTLAFVWALVVLGLAWRRAPPQLKRFAAGMLAIVVALLALILTNMSIVPAPWRLIQFPYRGETYVTLGVVALALGALLALPRITGRRRRAWATAAVVLIAVTSFGQAIVQQWSEGSSLTSRALVFQPNDKVPPSWYSTFDYADTALHDYPLSALIAIPGVKGIGSNGEPLLPVPVKGNHDSSAIAFRSPGPGPIATNLYGGPYLVKVTGARVTGRTPSNELVIEASAPKGRRDRVTVSLNHSTPVVLGEAVTFAAIILWALLAALGVGRWLLRRRRTDTATAARRQAPSAASSPPAA